MTGSRRIQRDGIQGGRFLRETHVLQEAHEFIGVLIPRRPARRETDHGVRVILLLPEAEGHRLREFRHLGVLEHDEDLVRGGFKEELVTRGAERVLDLPGVPDRGDADLFVEAVREERLKLDTGDAALREEGAMLLDRREEVR